MAIILDNDKLLVIKRDNQGKKYYALPGGGIEPGETPEQAVRREITEETSLATEFVRQIYQHNYSDGSTQYFYLFKYVSGQPRLSESAPEIIREHNNNFYLPIWYEVSQLNQILLYPLEVRDWIIEDRKVGFPEQVRSETIQLAKLRRSA